MKWKMTVKNKLYNGVTEGVHFANGEAIVTDERVKDLLAINYRYSAELIEAEPKKEEKKSKK